ncbi:MAG: hypothetical protein QM831_25320 [Kofleriaceae bacterium]
MAIGSVDDDVTREQFDELWRLIATGFADVKVALGNLDGRVSGLDYRVGALEGRVGALEGRVGALEANTHVMAAAMLTRDEFHTHAAAMVTRAEHQAESGLMLTRDEFRVELAQSIRGLEERLRADFYAARG